MCLPISHALCEGADEITGGIRSRREEGARRSARDQLADVEEGAASLSFPRDPVIVRPSIASLIVFSQIRSVKETLSPRAGWVIYAGNLSVEVSASDAEWPTNSRNLIGNGEAVRDLDRLGVRDELGREGLRRGRHVPPEASRGRSLG